MPSHAILPLLMLGIMPCVYSKRYSSVVSGDNQMYIKVDTQSNRSRSLLKMMKRRKAVGSAMHPGGELPKGVCTLATQHPYKKGRFIASGAFGKVYHAKACKSKQPLVLKEIRYTPCTKQPTECGSEHGFDPVEIKPMLLKLPFVADLQAVYYNNKSLERPIGILNRYYPGGDMWHHTKTKSPDLATIKLWGAQVAYALWTMHRSHFIYGDLKLENVFVVERKGTPAKRLVISDFGLSTENCGPTACTNRAVGTPEYVSPQIADNLLHHTGEFYGYEVDWWAHGILVANFDMEFPYRDLYDDLKETVKLISRGHPEFNRGIDEELRNYLSSIISKEPYMTNLANDASRKLMVSNNASDHPILKNPFWHGQTDASKIDEYWQQICEKYSLQPEKCGLPITVPDPSTSYEDGLCPSCDECKADKATCSKSCKIPEAKKSEVCNAISSFGTKGLSKDTGCTTTFNWYVHRSTRECCCTCLVSNEDPIAQNKPWQQICASK